MVDRIRMLDSAVAQKIAAGEVVERPSSVIKELVENSLDAGSSRVSIELTADGRDFLRVVDDGIGMSEHDGRLSFERHATSKITAITDLEVIRTFGFRGEALASIAAVSEVELVTRERGTLTGTKIVVQGGNIVEITSAGCPEGTSVTIRNLFYNTPARRKFLKTKATETAWVADLVNRLALANPEVGFSLKQSGRLLLKTIGNGDLFQVLAVVLGVDIVKHLIKLESKINGVELSGWIAKPFLHRSNRQQQIFFVNKRLVHSTLLSNAVEEAYAGKLPRSRHPVNVLDFRIDPSAVDVNIHPTKMQVKFLNDKEVAASVTEAIRQLLARTEAVPVIQPRPNSYRQHSGRSYQASLSAQLFDSGRLNIVKETLHQTAATGNVMKPQKPLEPPVKEIAHVKENIELPAPPPTAARTHSPWPGMEVLGQFAATYIVALGPDKLYLVDQHAAHERIRYERIRSQLQQNELRSQSLAVPLAVTLSAPEAQVLLDRIVQLRNLGFLIEFINDNELWLRGVPPGLSGSQGLELIKDLLDYVEEYKEGEVWEAATKLLACKGAIKAHQKLANEEMKRMLNQLAECEEPFTCPHGRPTTVAFVEQELARMFKR